MNISTNIVALLTLSSVGIVQNAPAASTSSLLSLPGYAEATKAQQAGGAKAKEVHFTSRENNTTVEHVRYEGGDPAAVLYSMENDATAVRIRYSLEDLPADDFILYADEFYVITLSEASESLTLWDARNYNYLCSVLHVYGYDNRWLGIQVNRLNYCARREMQRDIHYGGACQREVWVGLDIEACKVDSRNALGNMFNDARINEMPQQDFRYKEPCLAQAPALQMPLDLVPSYAVSTLPCISNLANAFSDAPALDLSMIDLDALRVRTSTGSPAGANATQKAMPESAVVAGREWKHKGEGNFLPAQSSAADIHDFAAKWSENGGDAAYYVWDGKTSRMYPGGWTRMRVYGSRSDYAGRIFFGESDCGIITQSIPRKEFIECATSLDNFVFIPDTGKLHSIGCSDEDGTMGQQYCSYAGKPIIIDKAVEGEDRACLSVWHSMPGSKDEYFWLVASERAVSLYHISLASMSGKRVFFQEYAAGAGEQQDGTPKHSAAPIWLEDKKLLCIPEKMCTWALYRMDENTATFGQSIGHLYTHGEKEFALVLPNGHYAGTAGCEDFLYAVEGETYANMQTLALWRNRPAEVLEALGAPTEEVEVLQQTTRRWLAKQGYNPDAMPAEPDFKDFARVEVDMPRLLTTDAETTFDVKLCPGAKDIARLIVRADGVEIPQEAAAGTSGGVTKSVSVTVPLATRENWIELTPVDTDGISGESCRFRVIRQGSAKPDLYIVSLGVSKYNDESLNLQYAAKDATDLAAAFEKYGTGEKKHVLLLTDGQVQDKGCLERVKGFLQSATVDDRVVFYCAGHGLLDEKLDYYYAPAGIDPEHVAETGISMKDLQAALEETPARERLLLLDTCHSGSVGEEDEDKLAIAGQLPHGVRAIQHRGMKVKKVAAALNTAQKKRYIEEMFSMGEGRRGVNVIAGSAGAEYAQESEEWNNGVFTSAVMECLKHWYRADRNSDGNLSVAELHNYVTTRVSQLTGGAQIPQASAVENRSRMQLVTSGKISVENCISLLADYQPKSEDDAKNVQLLKGLLENIAHGSGVHALAPDGSNYTALHYACIIGNYHIAKALLDMGANPEHSIGDYQSPPKERAAGNARKLFVNTPSQGAVPASTPQPASQPAPAPTPSASTEDRSDLQPMIDRMAALKCKQESSKLYQKRLLMLLPMIRNGADVNTTTVETKGNTALHYAVAIGSLSITRWLLEHGANPNAVTNKGASVMDCVGSDNGKAIRALLKQYGAGSGGTSYTPAPAPAPSYGKSGDRSDLQPMIDRMAALKCKQESSKLYQKRLLMLLPMIRDGADVNTTTVETKGNTALHYAVAIGSLSITKWLLEHGANPNAVTDKGASVMQCVGSDNGKAIRALLKQYGAN